MRRTLLKLAACLALMMVASGAQAQSSGIGFPLGQKSRLHTNLDLGFGYDSNPDRFQSSSTKDLPDWKSLIRPSLVAAVPGTAFNLDFRAQLSISQYLGLGLAQDRTLFGGAVNLRAAADDPSNIVGFKLENTVMRTPTVVDELGAVAADERRFKEWLNRGRAIGLLRPGGGALEFALGYTNELSFYDNNLPSSQRHGALFETKLRFLPRTAAIFHSDFSYFQGSDRQTRKSTPYNLSVGLVGQVTPRISADVEVGFADAVIWEGNVGGKLSTDNTRTPIGRAEVSYDLFDSSRISLGYRRSLRPTILLNNATTDALVFRFVIGLGGRLSFGTYVEYDWRKYSQADTKAQLLTGDAKLEYWFFEFLSAAVDYRILRQETSSVVAGAAQALVQDYIRQQAMLFVNIRY